MIDQMTSNLITVARSSYSDSKDHYVLPLFFYLVYSQYTLFPALVNQHFRNFSILAIKACCADFIKVPSKINEGQKTLNL